MSDPVTVAVVGCARCEHDHDAVAFQELDHPLEIEDVVLTHWALCPRNGQPILLRLAENA